MDVAGLVSSIITFVDFSWTIVRGTYDIHNSTSGATEQNVHVGHVLQDLRAVTEKMRRDLPGRDDHEKALLDLEYHCRGLSSDLDTILRKLTAKHRSGLRSLNVMFRSLVKEREVREIEKRLGEYREQMILRLNLILLERTAAVQNDLQLRQDFELAQLRGLKEKAENLTGDNSILRRLYFDDMYKRADGITDATYGTFDWLLTKQDGPSNKNASAQMADDEATNKPWYEDRERQERQERQESAAKISEFLEHGDGVFFLRGKPGSGKSTLMKYLIEGRGKQEVDRKLREWAGQKRLVRVSAMFLLHGTPLQRSLEGFYRTVFFELICQCPNLSDTLFPKSSKREPSVESYTSSFRFEILQAAWQKLASIKYHETLRLCISIDGMDELEGNSGDRLRFAQTLKQLAESNDMKIVCSGRPNAEFNKVFDEPRQIIDLQDLTRADIRKIAEKRFEEVSHVSDLTPQNIRELVKDISFQSEGVILWAILVGKSLQDDIIHGKSLKTMKRTIQALPSGIENLFNELFQELPRSPQQHLELRTICGLLEDGPRHALPLFWLDDALCDSNFPYNRPIKALEAVELNSRLEKVRDQLIQYTKHFVELRSRIPNDDQGYHRTSCGFIHRSAQEFIQSKFDSVGTSLRSLDPQILDLGHRLNLMFEMSVKRQHPNLWIHKFLKTRIYTWKTAQTYRESQFYQPQPRLLDKLRELSVLYRNTARSDGRVFEDQWHEVRYRSLGTKDTSIIYRSESISLFHLALSGHQVDHVAGILKDKSQGLSREDLSLGLLTSAVAMYPNYKLFNLLIDHGADPDCLVKVYRAGNQATPELIPLWLLFCFTLAFKAEGWYIPYSPGVFTGIGLNMALYHEFLILERFLHLGFGSNVGFLAAPITSQEPSMESVSEPDERDLFGVDLAQIVRFAKPDNMDRLLLLLESPRATLFSLAQSFTSLVLQTQFPFRSLPQGATTTTYRRVTDECLRRERWGVWVAFDGEHEIGKDFYFFVPGTSGLLSDHPIRSLW